MSQWLQKMFILLAWWPFFYMIIIVNSCDSIILSSTLSFQDVKQAQSQKVRRWQNLDLDLIWKLMFFLLWHTSFQTSNRSNFYKNWKRPKDLWNILTLLRKTKKKKILINLCSHNTNKQQHKTEIILFKLPQANFFTQCFHLCLLSQLNKQNQIAKF